MPKITILTETGHQILDGMADRIDSVFYTVECNAFCGFELVGGSRISLHTMDRQAAEMFYEGYGKHRPRNGNEVQNFTKYMGQYAAQAPALWRATIDVESLKLDGRYIIKNGNPVRPERFVNWKGEWTNAY